MTAVGARTKKEHSLEIVPRRERTYTTHLHSTYWTSASDFDLFAHAIHSLTRAPSHHKANLIITNLPP